MEYDFWQIWSIYLARSRDKTVDQPVEPKGVPVSLRAARGTDTQYDVGEKLARLSGSQFSAKTYQSRISEWETGKSRPDEAETKGLAEIFRLDPSVVRNWFPATIDYQYAVLQLLDKIKDGAHEVLMIVCASGVPAGDRIPALPAAIIRAVTGSESTPPRLSFALAVPYPNVPDADARDRSPKTRLLDYQISVLRQVQHYCQDLREAVKANAPEALNRIQMFIPKTEATNILIPPFQSRYTLTVENRGGALDRRLYLWVLTDKKDDLELVETTESPKNVEFPISRVWSGYCQDIIDAWDGNNRGGFPKKYEGDYWKIEPIEV